MLVRRQYGFPKRNNDDSYGCHFFLMPSPKVASNSKTFRSFTVDFHPLCNCRISFSQALSRLSSMLVRRRYGFPKRNNDDSYGCHFLLRQMAYLAITCITPYGVIGV